MQEGSAVSPYMFTKHVPKEHFMKTTQWVTLTRAAAYVAVHDRLAEPWFATFAGSHWRCAFIEEGKLVLDGVAQLLRQDQAIVSGHNAAALQLRTHGLLPQNFSTGAFCCGL